MGEAQQEQKGENWCLVQLQEAGRGPEGLAGARLSARRFGQSRELSGEGSFSSGTRDHSPKEGWGCGIGRRKHIKFRKMSMRGGEW